MKKMFLLSVTLLMLIVACKKKEGVDEGKPSINSVLINGSDMLNVSENVISNGEKLTFRISVSDDIALSELSVEIHEAGGGHEHETIDKTGSELSQLAFGPKIYDLGGGNMKLISVEVTNNLSNELTDYHLELILLDKASNRETTIQTFEIE